MSRVTGKRRAWGKTVPFDMIRERVTGKRMLKRDLKEIRV